MSDRYQIFYVYTGTSDIIAEEIGTLVPRVDDLVVHKRAPHGKENLYRVSEVMHNLETMKSEGKPKVQYHEVKVFIRYA